MGLGNPVDKAGRIQANGEVWSGSPTFRVTSTFQQHAASGRALGIDFGNGRCGDPVYAMEGGTVTLAGLLGTANVIRIRHPNGYTSGYAHLATVGVRVSQVVTKGQVIGQLGKTGADACHLHGGYTNPAGAEVDFWPLLDQNAAGADMNITITNYPGRRDCATKGGTLVGYRLNPAPLTKSGTFAAGSGFHSDAEYAASPTPAGWPAGPYQRVVDGFYAGYLVANSQITLGPVPTGASQAALDAAYNAGVDAAAVKAKEAKK